MRFTAVAAAVLLALCGCAPTQTLPPAPAGDELDELIAVELDFQWQYVGLPPDGERPAVERERIVSGAEAQAVHHDCMVDAGYEDYTDAVGAIFGGASIAMRVAIYECSARFPVPPSEFNLYSENQLEFLYDYYVTSVIPCLEATGVHVKDVPPRDEFVHPERFNLFSWSPFEGLESSSHTSYLASEKCRNVPEGFPLE